MTTFIAELALPCGDINNLSSHGNPASDKTPKLNPIKFDMVRSIVNKNFMFFATTPAGRLQAQNQHPTDLRFPYPHGVQQGPSTIMEGSTFDPSRPPPHTPTSPSSSTFKY
jgi:hypothetical protein